MTPAPRRPPDRSPAERTIRIAVPADWPRLRAVQAASLPSGWPDLLRIAVENDAATAGVPSSRTPPTARGPFALVAVVEGTRVGYALVVPGGSGDERTPNDDTFDAADAPDAPDEHRSGERRADGTAVHTLVELAVAPGRRREGHGSALLETVLALDDRAVELTVRVDDQRARRFYAEHGFRVRERLPEYYEDGAGLVLVGGN